VRVRLGEELVADSRRALLAVQYGPGPVPGVFLPTYYLPREDVADGVLTDAVVDDDGTTWWTVAAGGREVERAAWAHARPDPAVAALADHVSFSWQHLAWFEEEERLRVHARDPHKRVDVLASSRHVRVEAAGQLLAESTRPLLLFETGLPTRYYLPAEDVCENVLEPSATRTTCPYKGNARYWTARAGGTVLPDVAWSYPEPIAECPRIAGLVAFLDEHVDVTVDGVRQERPHTAWS
jgi:uncharacterized protein (DUF427 family)